MLGYFIIGIGSYFCDVYFNFSTDVTCAAFSCGRRLFADILSFLSFVFFFLFWSMDDVFDLD